MGLLPEGAKRDGEVLFKGDDILQMSVNDARAMRGADLGMIFQEPLTRLNPLMRISEHFEETIKQHEPGADARRRSASGRSRCCG